MAANLLIPPFLQFSNPSGVPYAFGKLSTYIPATFTPKLTWADVGQATANTNPITLTEFGSCVVYGDGDYRLILKDADDNQIFDTLSSEPLPSDAISGAVAPAVAAATLSQFRDLAGITTAISTAVSNIELMGGPTGPQGESITGPTGPSGPMGPPGLGANTSNANPGYFYDPVSKFLIQFGTSVSTVAGDGNVSFARPFVNLNSITCSVLDPTATNPTIKAYAQSASGFSVFIETVGFHPIAATFSWSAFGFG